MKIMITCSDVMMYQFLLPHAKALSNGNVVDAIVSSTELYKNEGYIKKIREELGEKHVFTVENTRSPFSIDNIKTEKRIKRIIKSGKYDLIWTNEPVMSVLTRLAAREARKKGTKVLYCAHGYHFFAGAPLSNWLFYPVEKFMAHFCDEIVLINWEDYSFTKKHMKYVSCDHIDGIGFNPSRFKNVDCNVAKKRKEIGIGEKEIVLLSVGEIQPRKNHEPVIDALAKLNRKDIKLLICGYGELLEYLQNKCKKLGIESQVLFLGHRYDIPELMHSADVLVHPSRREGLGMAVLEAMAAGLPIITTNVQGLKDLVENGENGIVVSPRDVQGFADAINELSSSVELREEYGRNNRIKAENYSLDNSISQMKAIIKKVNGERL